MKKLLAAWLAQSVLCFLLELHYSLENASESTEILRLKPWRLA